MKILFVMTTMIVVMAPTLAWAQEMPILDPTEPRACATTPDGEEVQLQCDEATKRCLVAPVEVQIDDDRDPNARVLARGLDPCSQSPPGAYERLVADGYTMVRARLSAPYGYKRDERNRLFQTHFDLRRRYFVGVGDALVTDTGFSSLDQSLKLEVGGSYEAFDPYDVRRHRYRFLEGSVLIAPLEIDALLFAYDRGRISNRPDLWITTFVGEPQRFDINLDIGPGLFFGRLWFGDVADTNTALIDLAQGHLNWELFQSRSLEDYFLIRVGGGLGLRARGSETVQVYLYPEAALMGAWRAGERGLWEFGFDVRGRIGGEVDSGEVWYEVRGATSMERILIAINDQPLSLFVEPSVSYLDADFGNRSSVQVLAGGRISFFVPAPKADRE